ncbi:MAG: hypothetical protein M1820_008677 [Bogoriella megaspora]|nr:MAG: hypothetical protein M1820_008677 [Bogoriella megaspora]
MPTEKELETAISKLTEVKQNHNAVNEVLESYGKLLQDHKRLLSDLEEERDRREFYKQQAKGQDRDAYVLVLIDGDGYVFDDNLVSEEIDGQRKCTEKGGLTAADRLDAAIQYDLRGRDLGNCRVEALVYANVAGLSKALSRQGLAGQHSRSLANFATGFTRGRSHFDYVDAGELKEGADFKIKAKLESAIANVQCKHIYFAGCHDVGYINLLQPFSGNSEQSKRITLLKGPSFHSGFTALGFEIQEPKGYFRNIFRATPLELYTNGHAAPNTKPVLATKPTTTPASITVPLYTSRNDPTNSSQVCKYFLQGKCTFGSSCRNVHPSQPIAPKSPLLTQDPPTNQRSELPASSTLAATHLPRSGNEPYPGAIPVNNNSYRLDFYMPPPSALALRDWKARTSRQGVCNTHHLGAGCTNADCKYDHSPLSLEQLEVLKVMNKGQPCKRGGACRKADCRNGHVCQKECRGSKIHGLCRLWDRAHTEDFRVVRWAEPEVFKDTEGEVEGGSTKGSETVEGSVGGGEGRDSEADVKTLDTFAADTFYNWRPGLSQKRKVSNSEDFSDSDDDENEGGAGAQLGFASP